MPLTGIVDDRYQIERELGRGGMATVYLARDLRHGNRVAIKILTSDFATQVSGERFTREIRITAGLQHPHILPVFDSGTLNGHPYYVMPFVEGPTLAERIKSHGPLPVDDALEIACEVADALEHAHARGIVHRDIKPSNILLADGHAVVADFGVARAVESIADQDLTRTGIAVGTAAYMSPEQAAGEDVDGRSDIYSLGCVLYEMLAGKPPYAAPNPRALMAKHWMTDVPSLRDARRSVRGSIEALVKKAMAKRASERFATAGQLEAAIKSVSTEERIAAIGFTPSDDQPTFTPPEVEQPVLPPPEKAKSRRGLYIALGVAIVAVAAWWLARPREATLDRNRVLVYPLLVPDDFKGPRSVGEDIGTMIGTALDGVGNLRWIDGWPLLTTNVRQDVRNLTGTDARAIARSRRAAWYLAGRIVTRGDSSEVYVELNDVAGDSTVARGHAKGATTDAWRTGLHAVNAILPALIPQGIRQSDLLTEWNDRDPAAIAAFLLGESAFRRVHLTEALQHYRDALKADSTFALAAIRGAQAAAWNHRSDEAETFIQSAMRRPLSPRYSHFARGYQAYLDGSADTASEELKQAIALDPEMSAAWMQLGEVYTHLLPLTGRPDSMAKIAFDEAYRIDPAAKHLLLHSIEIRVRSGQTDSIGSMVRDFLSSDPDTLLALQVQMMYNCARGGTNGVQWRQQAKLSAMAVLSAANSFKGGGSRLACAMSAYDAVMNADTSQAAAGRRWSGILGLTTGYLAQGKIKEARATMDMSIAHNWGGVAFYLMGGLLYPQLSNAARANAARDETAFGPKLDKAPNSIRLWQLGVWEAVEGNKAVADGVVRGLNARAAKSGLASERRLSRSVAAFLALSRGDSATAFREFESLVAEPVPGNEIVWDLANPRGMERLTLGRLLLARGDYRKALDVANVFDAAWPSIYLLYLPASLQLRIDAAKAFPDARLASQYSSRLAAIRGESAVAGQ